MNKNPTSGPKNRSEMAKIQAEIVQLEQTKQELNDSINNYHRLFADSGYHITTSNSEIREDEEDLDRKCAELSSVNTKLAELQNKITKGVVDANKPLVNHMMGQIINNRRENIR